MATEIRTNNLNLSEEEEESEGTKIVELKGYLNKWTNYIHGWQRRFIVFKDGTLSYYKSELEAGHGCRGTISLRKASIKPHEFDECRFDVSVNDNVWYLRADTPEEKQHFVDLLEACKLESGYGSDCNLKRHGSGLSLGSNNISATSINSLLKDKALKEKLAELGTFRDILCQQIDTLQSFYDRSASDNNFDLYQESQAGDLHIKDQRLFLHQFDLKGEALTFRATTNAVIERLQHCIDVMGQREDLWARKVDHEKERRRRLEEMVRSLRTQIASPPDLEEGPHSTLADDEFYDAVETELDKMEEEVRNRQAIKHQMSVMTENSNNNLTNSAVDKKKPNTAEYHRLWPEIERITKEQVKYAQMGLGDNAWQLFAEEGEMKMYRRFEEIDGIVVDPLKACHVVKGVTGHEMCHYFFSPQYRYDWETTIEQMTVVESISDDTLIFLQLHKRIWPTTQRDALFWSHIRQVPNDSDPDAHDLWIVVNHSTELPQYQPNNKKCIRLLLTVSLLCQTLVTPPKEGSEVTRDDITCKITYCSVVNPGGWAPGTVLRALYKREYPKFLKRFTGYVIDQCKNKPIMF